MKILFVPPERSKVHKSTCSVCRTIVELEPRDCEYRIDDRDGDAVVWLCPTCTHENWVSLDVVGHAFSRAVSTKEG